MENHGYIINSQYEKVGKLLKCSREIVYSVLRTSYNAVAFLNEKGEFIYVNDITLDILGIDKNIRIFSKNIFDLLKVYPYGIYMLNQGSTVAFNTDTIKSDFFSNDIPISHFKISITPIFERGELSSYCLIITDISDYVKSENILKEQDEQLSILNKYIELIINKSDISLWRFYYEDDNKTKIAGEKLIGRTLNSKRFKFDNDQLKKLFSTSNYYKFKENIILLLEGQVSNKVVTLDYEQKHDITGDKYYYRHTSTKVTLENSITEILTIIYNLTDIFRQKNEIKISDFKSKLLIQGGGLIPWEYDVINKKHTYDYDPTLFGKSDYINDLSEYIELVEPHCRETLIKSYQRFINGEDVTDGFEYSFIPKGHISPIYLRTYYTPYVKDENGKVLRYIGYTKDISQKIALLSEMKQAKEGAEIADRLKSQFLTNMSHEIRTPLNAIVGFSEMLSYAKTAEDKQKWQKYISTNGELLLQLINDILDLSKIESGVSFIEKEEFDLASYFDEISLKFKSLASNSNVEFVVSNPYERVIINSNKDKIGQIIINFATNALKYTKKGYIKLAYEVLEDRVKIFVKDTGIGISEDNKKRVFSRFEKLDIMTQGTGLGLAIVKALLDQLGGECGCESVLGKGSYFWAEFPSKIIEVNNKSNIKRVQLLKDAEFMEEIKNKNLKILITEDIDSNFVLISSILEGLNLTRAYNGQEAVDLMRQQSFDIVLMDIQMPVMNGIQAIIEIRKFDTKTPIIVLSANAYDSDKAKALDVGANDFVPKPFRRGIMFNIISKYVNDRR